MGVPGGKFRSGFLGRDEQIGARIAEGESDSLSSLKDPLETIPHDTDLKTILRKAMAWNIPLACNRVSADFIFFSLLMS